MTRTASSTLPIRRRSPGRTLPLHRWIGRVLMLYLLAIFTSGTLLVFGSELESLVSPQMRRNGGAAAPQSLGAVLDAARTAYPGAAPLILRPPASGWFAAEVELRQDGRDFIVWVDPATAGVQGTTPVLGLREVLRRFHTTLLVDSRVMLLAATSVSVLLAAQVLLGLAGYPRFWRGYLRRPAAHPPGRNRWGGWHRWTGLWSLPVLSVIALTGMFYFVEALGFTPDLPEPARAVERAEAMPGGFDGAALDRVLAVAQDRLPGLRVREVYFPTMPTGGVTVRGDLDAILVRPRGNAVTVDPVTMAPLGSFRGEDLSLARRLTEAADPLHFGTWGGQASRSVWLVSGLLAVALVFSGLRIASWRMSDQPGRPSMVRAVRSIFLPARMALIGAAAVCLSGAVMLLT